MSERLGRGLVENAGSITETTDGPLKVLSLMARLKQTKRTGWVDNGVPNAESIADHCQRTAMCAMFVAAEDTTLDREKVVEMALIHDAGESIVGDVTPRDKVTRDEKAAAEDAAFRSLESIAGANTKLHALWREFEDGKTPEAMVVAQLDKFEMVLQAVEYERANEGLDLEPFFASTRGMFVHPTIKRWAEQIEAHRPKNAKH